MVVSDPGSSEIVSEPDENTPVHPSRTSKKTTPPSTTPLSPPYSPSTPAQTQSSSSTNDGFIPDPTILISPPIPVFSPPSFNNAITISPDRFTQEIDDDVVQYNLMHGRGDASVVRRLPESFPSGYAQSLRSSPGPPESLPAYGANEPPRYTRFDHDLSEEPRTLPRIFFKMGFLFPAFWFCGALMLSTSFRSPSPLNQTSRWSPNTSFATWCNEHLETEEEKAEFITKFQVAERKWAKRCLLALFIVACFGIAFGAMIYGVLKSTSSKSPTSNEQSSTTWTS